MVLVLLWSKKVQTQSINVSTDSHDKTLQVIAVVCMVQTVIKRFDEGSNV